MTRGSPSTTICLERDFIKHCQRRLPLGKIKRDQPAARRQTREKKAKTREEGTKRPFPAEAPHRRSGRGGRVTFSRGRARGARSNQTNRGKRVFFTVSNSVPRTGWNSGKESCTGGSGTRNELKFTASSSKGSQPHSGGEGASHGGGGEIEILSTKLAKADTRQLYSSSCSGVTNTLYHPSSADFPPFPIYNRQKGNVDRFRGSGHVSKRCYKTSAAMRRSVSEPCLFCSKEGCGQQTSNKSEKKKLNQNIEYQHFKMEGIQSLKSLIQKGDFMVKLDLREAYFSLPMHQNSLKYLRFVWKGKTYEFLALPFGLGVGPRYFTKTLKPVIAFLRQTRVRIVIYLDDMILLNQSSQMLLRSLTSLRWLLENLGFLINWKKSAIIPVQEIQFLGYLINSVEMMIMLPSDKIIRIAEKYQRMVQEKVTMVRKLAEILGCKTSSLQAIAPAPLHYRYLQMTQIRGLLENRSYQSKVILTPECLQELRYWISHMRDWNGKA